MIFTAYGEVYSEKAELMSKLSGNRHCARCVCEIKTGDDCCHTPRRHDGGTMYLCNACATTLNWKRAEMIRRADKSELNKKIKLVVDGIKRRNVL